MPPTPPDPAWPPPPEAPVASEWDDPNPAAPTLPAQAARWTWISGIVCTLGLALVAAGCLALSRTPLPELEQAIASALPGGELTPQQLDIIRQSHAQAPSLGRSFGLVALGVGLLHALLALGVRQGSRPATYTALILTIGEAIALAWILLNGILAIAVSGSLGAPIIAPLVLSTASLLVVAAAVRRLWQARRLET